MQLLKNKIRIVLHGIIGIPNTEGFEHSYFNAVAFTAGLMGILLGIVKFWIGLGLISAVVLAFGVLMSIAYGLARFRGFYRPLIVPVLLLYPLVLTLYWFYNAGSAGGTQYYFFVGGLVSLFLAPGGRKKVLIVVLYLALATALSLVEEYAPHLITGPASEITRDRYLFFSFLASQFVLYLMLIIISSNFEQALKILGQYHDTFEEDLALARTVQQQVLQYSPEITADFDFALVHRASAELSGDMYDLSRPDPTFLRVLLADARGHGINASLISMLIKSEWMNVNARGLSPGLLMDRLNKRIFARYGESLSLSAIVVDIYRNRLVYASGGHVPQFLMGSGTATLLEAQGPPLGILSGAEYPEYEHEFGEDHRLFLFTDALTEEIDLNGQAIGLDWLRGLIATPLPAAEHTRRIIERLADLKGQSVEKLDCMDDLTLIAIGIARR